MTAPYYLPPAWRQLRASVLHQLDEAEAAATTVVSEYRACVVYRP